MKYALAIIVTLQLISGCAMIEEAGNTNFFKQLYKPRPWGLGETPDGTPEFQKGWNDGCDTGLGVYGNDRYKWAYTFKQDVNLVKNPEYYRAWKDAYTHCRWYVWGWGRPWRE